MIKIQDLQKYFGQLHVLRGIDLQVEKGEVLSVIGASGSGKSTLLYCINGLEQIQGGTITVDGVKVHDKGTDLKLFKSLLKGELKFEKMQPLNDILKELEKENLIVIMRGTRIRTSKDGMWYAEERYSEVYSRERIDRIAESKNTIVVTGRRV